LKVKGGESLQEAGNEAGIAPALDGPHELLASWPVFNGHGSEAFGKEGWTS